MLRHDRSAGFTLLEVMVALVVIGIGLGAVLKSASSQARNAAYLEQKTYAHWVAMNRMTRLQLAGNWSATREQKGRDEMAGQEWHWIVKLVDVTNREASQAGFRRVDIEVRLDEDDAAALATLSSYLIVRQP